MVFVIGLMGDGVRASVMTGSAPGMIISRVVATQYVPYLNGLFRLANFVNLRTERGR
jgi:hypothetical protein